MTTELSIVIPLITLLVGWLLGEASSRRREISSDRRAISRAIADLLEVRHRTFGIKAYMDALIKKFNVPQQAQPIITSVLQVMLPNSQSLQARYNDSVNAVSSANPLLGFQLRSKDELPKFLAILRQIASQDATATQVYPQFEGLLMDVIKSPMDDFILELAKTHGWRTWRKVKKFLREPLLQQKDLDEYFGKLESLIPAASRPTSDDARSGR